MSKLSAVGNRVWRGLRRDARQFVVLLLLGAAGCSEPLPTIANPEQARSALQEALDAWRKGETAQSLQVREPAIHVNDPDWRSSKQLVMYKLGSEQAHGNSWSCEVVLTVQDRQGKQTQQHANYTVDTAPKLVVVRDIVE